MQQEQRAQQADAAVAREPRGAALGHLRISAHRDVLQRALVAVQQGTECARPVGVLERLGHHKREALQRADRLGHTRGARRVVQRELPQQRVDEAPRRAALTQISAQHAQQRAQHACDARVHRERDTQVGAPGAAALGLVRGHRVELHEQAQRAAHVRLVSEARGVHHHVQRLECVIVHAGVRVAREREQQAAHRAGERRGVQAADQAVQLPGRERAARPGVRIAVAHNLLQQKVHLRRERMGPGDRGKPAVHLACGAAQLRVALQQGGVRQLPHRRVHPLVGEPGGTARCAAAVHRGAQRAQQADHAVHQHGHAPPRVALQRAAPRRGEQVLGGAHLRLALLRRQQRGEQLERRIHLGSCRAHRHGRRAALGARERIVRLGGQEKQRGWVVHQRAEHGLLCERVQRAAEVLGRLRTCTERARQRTLALVRQARAAALQARDAKRIVVTHAPERRVGARARADGRLRCAALVPRGLRKRVQRKRHKAPLHGRQRRRRAARRAGGARPGHHQRKAPHHARTQHVQRRRALAARARLEQREHVAQERHHPARRLGREQLAPAVHQEGEQAAQRTLAHLDQEGPWQLAGARRHTRAGKGAAPHAQQRRQVIPCERCAVRKQGSNQRPGGADGRRRVRQRTLAAVLQQACAERKHALRVRVRRVERVRRAHGHERRERVRVSRKASAERGAAVVLCGVQRARVPL